MSNRRNKTQIVEEVPYGMYVWRLPDGEYAGDSEGRVMNVFCIKGDREAIKALTDAARYYGFENGTVEWWTGKRRVDDDTYDEQVARAAAGLVPDPFDYGAIKDHEKLIERDRRL